MQNIDNFNCNFQTGNRKQVCKYWYKININYQYSSIWYCSYYNAFVVLFKNEQIFLEENNFNRIIEYELLSLKKSCKI